MRIAMLALTLLAATGLSACVSIDTTSKSRVETTTRDVDQAAPAYGVETTVQLGDVMVKLRDHTEVITNVEVMEVSENFRLTGFGSETMDFTAGQKLAILGERMVGGKPHDIALIPDWGFGLQIAPDGSLTPSLINTDVEMIWKVKAEPDTVRFKRVPFSTVKTKARNPGGRNIDIAYNGLDGQSMKFQFREYAADDVNRPLTSQDFALPVGTREVAIKGVQFEVLSATPTSIIFKRTRPPAVDFPPPPPAGS